MRIATDNGSSHDDTFAEILVRVGNSGQIVASNMRSQSRKHDLAEEKLADLVRRALVSPMKRRSTRPNKASKEARLDPDCLVHSHTRNAEMGRRVKRKRGLSKYP
jgi:hypothetical protein